MIASLPTFMLYLIVLPFAGRVDGFLVLQKHRREVAFRPHTHCAALENMDEKSAAFVPFESSQGGADEEVSDDLFEKVEMLGKGAAKVW